MTEKAADQIQAQEAPANGQAQASVEVGLVGSGIQASLSPRLHETEGAAMGISYRYRIFDVPAERTEPEVLAALVDDCERSGLAGLNVTHPFKQDVLPLLDELSAEADAIGAANTIVFRGGRRIGHNTDWWGFGESLRRGLPHAARDRVLLLGAGGAGAAIAYALMKTGVKHLGLYDVDAGRADRLADRIGGVFGRDRATRITDLEAAIAAAQGIVNATPIGMDRHVGSPVRAALLRREHWIADVVYFPLETQLLRDARAAGCPTLDGGGMAVFQAAKAFELFSGRVPDVNRMLDHFAALTGQPAPVQ